MTTTPDVPVSDDTKKKRIPSVALRSDPSHHKSYGIPKILYLTQHPTRVKNNSNFHPTLPSALNTHTPTHTPTLHHTHTDMQTHTFIHTHTGTHTHKKNTVQRGYDIGHYSSICNDLYCLCILSYNT